MREFNLPKGYFEIYNIDSWIISFYKGDSIRGNQKEEDSEGKKEQIGPRKKQYKPNENEQKRQNPNSNTKQ